MANPVTFVYDQTRNFLQRGPREARDREQVDAFLDEYRRYWEALGKKSWLITNIDDLFVDGQVADHYAEGSLRIMARHLLGFALGQPTAGRECRCVTTALKARMPAAIYSSRAEPRQPSRNAAHRLPVGAGRASPVALRLPADGPDALAHACEAKALATIFAARSTSLSSTSRWVTNRTV